MTHYEEIIKKATNCQDSDLNEIEEYMRNIIFHSTLDWQTRAQLSKAAKDAWKDIQYMRSPEGIAYMKKLESDMLKG